MRFWVRDHSAPDLRCDFVCLRNDSDRDSSAPLKLHLQLGCDRQKYLDEHAPGRWGVDEKFHPDDLRVARVRSYAKSRMTPPSGCNCAVRCDDKLVALDESRNAVDTPGEMTVRLGVRARKRETQPRREKRPPV